MRRKGAVRRCLLLGSTAAGAAGSGRSSRAKYVMWGLNIFQGEMFLN